MQGDIFTHTQSVEKKNEFLGDNFFVQPEQIITSPRDIDAARHLNDYDLNILSDDAYKDVSDERFKLEYKINRLKSYLLEIEDKINAVEDIEDYTQMQQLELQKKQICEDLKDLNMLYKDSCLSAKLSGGLLDRPDNVLDNSISNILKTLYQWLSKLPIKLPLMPDAKGSLAKLEAINKNVNELMSADTPYGEADDKYLKLSKYIARANYLQSEISKKFNNK